MERRKELTYLLCQAAELEHALMCQYLYAAFSLKHSGSRSGQASWRLSALAHLMILAIAGEEMLHWAMVQNLLTAVGSAPYVHQARMPHQAEGYPPGGAAFACSRSARRRCSTSCTWSGRKG